MEKKQRSPNRSTLKKLLIQTEEALLKRALGFSQEELYIEDIIDKKSGEPLEIAKRKVVTKQVAPDVRALLFWLKNRYPDRWREKIEPPETMEEYEFDEIEKLL